MQDARKADCILFTYDVTDQGSFNAAKEWKIEVDKCVSETVPKIFVGCKSDLVSERIVDHETAMEFCNSFKIHHLETSAKNNHGVADLFFLAARLCLYRWLSLSSVGEKEACMAMKCMSAMERRYLSSLDLRNNMLSHIPQEVFLCENLVSVDLTKNCLTALPASLLRLPWASITFKQNPVAAFVPFEMSPEMLRQYFAAQFCERSIVCTAMIWRFRESVWRLLGRDVMKIIAGMLWRTRGDTRCWVNEAAIVSMEEQEKRTPQSTSIGRRIIPSCSMQ
jgi:Ras family